MIINLWSGPRNISTALMYSFANRSDFKVVDEPFYAHYLAKTGLDHPGRKEVLEGQSTDSKTVLTNEIYAHSADKHVLIKNMAHHSEHLDTSFSNEMINIFLVREPDQMITSFIKQIPNPTIQDLAYKHQFDLLNQQLEAGQKPIVIDSKTLLENPSIYLPKLCLALDIEFEESMLKWAAGPIKEDGVWAPYWYASVHKSTGFQPYKRKDEVVPAHLIELLNECQEYYSHLINYAL